MNVDARIAGHDLSGNTEFRDVHRELKERRPQPVIAHLSRTEWMAATLLFLLVALVTRAPLFGNPVIHIDEQFYLLVGDRMLHGALPYVDMWDRKPFGLFALYAAIRMLGGEGIYQYQIIAMLAAASTALLLYRIARTIAPPLGAAIAGIAYLLYLLTFNGAGGQSSVFYNLPVAIAALWTLRAMTVNDGRGLPYRGAAIMLLLGLAIQIKYTVVFEGMFFGLALMWRHWRDRRNVQSLAASAVLWMTCALLPTIVALCYYVTLGQQEAFLQANFLSIFGREDSLAACLKRLLVAAGLLTPFLLAIRGGKFLVPGDEIEWVARRFLCCWAVAAVAGYLLFGSFYDHYAIPLLLPLSIVAAPALGVAGRSAANYRVIILLAGLVSGALSVNGNFHGEGSREQMARLAALVRPHLRSGCLYVYEGPPILYKMTNACFVTPYVFPSHLNNKKEQRALGVRAEDAMHQILARRPEVIVMAEKARPKKTNFVTRALLLKDLRANYDLIDRVPLGGKTLLVWKAR